MKLLMEQPGWTHRPGDGRAGLGLRSQNKSAWIASQVKGQLRVGGLDSPWSHVSSNCRMGSSSRQEDAALPQCSKFIQPDCAEYVRQVCVTISGHAFWVGPKGDLAVGQDQWYRFGVGAPPILEPIVVGIWMFTGGTIWILTHGHLSFETHSGAGEARGPRQGSAHLLPLAHHPPRRRRFEKAEREAEREATSNV